MKKMSNLIELKQCSVCWILPVVEVNPPSFDMFHTNFLPSKPSTSLAVHGNVIKELQNNLLITKYKITITLSVA